MTTVKLKSPRQLAAALRRLAKGMDGGSVKALQRTARWGATHAVKVSASITPRPRARGTYERSFVVTKLPDGAALSNSARHAIFVEVGRRPGRMPPVKVILDWMIAKKIDKKMGRALGRDAKGKFRSVGKERLLAVAWMISRKIGRSGTRGRYVMRTLLPLLRKRMDVEFAAQMKKVFDAQRGRG